MVGSGRNPVQEPVLTTISGAQQLLRAGRALAIAGMLCAAAALTARPAHAGGLDLHLERLATAATDDTGGKVKNANYEHLMRELTLAFGPRMMGPAASLGPLGIEAAYELGVAGANDSADYWKKTVDSPSSSLVTHAIHVRKGLPFSAQVGTSLTSLSGSNMMAIGAELNLSVIDGFKHVPDVAIDIAVQDVIGFPANSAVDMVILGWGTTVSKSFGIAGLFALQPWASYTGTYTYVNTHQILIAPHAGFIGGGSELTLFDKVEAIGQRGAIGLRIIGTRIQFGGEFMRSFTDDLNIMTGKLGVAF